MKIAIRGGKVYDPAHGIDGQVRTIHIDGGTIIADPGRGFTPDRTIDAGGRIVMPGGVDMHCHIVGPAVNRARRLIAGPEWRSASLSHDEPLPPVPPACSTGLRYSLLGYTTAIEAAIAPSGAAACHAELADTPNLDRGFLLLLGNHELLFDLLARGEDRLARQVVAWLLRSTGAYGIKAVNPGGVAHWLDSGQGIEHFDEPIAGRRVSPRRIVEFLATTADELALPHPLHVHCNRLGTPGNIEITLATSRALSGRRHHLTHAQFHAYGRTDDGDFTSAAARLVEHIDAHPEVTIDVGQVMFGQALTLTADAEVEHYLWRLTGKPYVNVEVDLETGCGTIPLEYRRDSRLHARQWAIGLELFLLCRDPWRIALSTDHPNGGSFLAYPTLVAQLMDRNIREAAIAAADPRAIATSDLMNLDRQYTLSEIAIITRAAPARMLGLERKGHLGPGADADVTIYDDRSDREAMFRWPWLVMQSGRIVVDDGEPRGRLAGRTLSVAPPSDDEAERFILDWYGRYGSYDPRQMAWARGAS